ncbi:hypothetical protein L1049_016727 [Liquidambar formosana]|uniref:Uncharacterized protein n=1 Tax=Liquidambar formosana TaxID=63359 RepID=A0AAP0RZN8_LIQFO
MVSILHQSFIFFPISIFQITTKSKIDGKSSPLSSLLFYFSKAAERGREPKRKRHELAARRWGVNLAVGYKWAAKRDRAVRSAAAAVPHCFQYQAAKFLPRQAAALAARRHYLHLHLHLEAISRT